jgi:glycosyltransferase involved in cell wall biosynthesis
VVFVTTNLDGVGGIATYSRALVSALDASADLDVVELAPPERRTDRALDIARVNARLARGRPDLLVLGHVRFGPAAWAWHRLRRPYAVLAYGIDIWGEPSPAHARTLRRATSVWPISNWTAAEVLRVVPGATIGPVLGGTITEASFQDHEPVDGPFRVLFVGSLRDLSYKGLDTLILAGQAVAAGRPLEIRVVGSGRDEDKLAPFVAEHDHAGIVRILGSLDDEALRAEYRRADVLTLVTHFRRGPNPSGEGLGLVVLEAAAAGTPSIVADQGGLADVVIEGETGVSIPAGSVDELAAVLDKFAADPAGRTRMGETGRAFVRERHTLDAFTRRVDLGVREALEDHARGRR